MEDIAMKVNEVMISNPIMAIHLFAGIGALFIGGLQIFGIPRGTKEHMTIGRLWIALLLVLVSTSFVDFMKDGFISMPAHVFTIITVILVPLAVWAARNDKFQLHKYCMLGVFYGAVVVAFLALLAVPGRLFNTWFF